MIATRSKLFLRKNNETKKKIIKKYNKKTPLKVFNNGEMKEKANATTNQFNKSDNLFQSNLIEPVDELNHEEIKALSNGIDALFNQEEYNEQILNKNMLNLQLKLNEVKYKEIKNEFYKNKIFITRFFSPFYLFEDEGLNINKEKKLLQIGVFKLNQLLYNQDVSIIYGFTLVEKNNEIFIGLTIN